MLERGPRSPQPLLRRQEEVGLWGHEYVRNIAGEIGQEYAARREADAPVDDLLELVAQIVPYHMSHNAGAARRSRAGPCYL